MVNVILKSSLIALLQLTGWSVYTSAQHNRDLAAQEVMQGSTGLAAHTDLLYVRGKGLFQDFYIQSTVKQKAVFTIDCYRYTSVQDSMLMYRYESTKQMLDKGKSKVILSFQEGRFQAYPSFASVVKRTGIVPPATYKLYVHVTGDSSQFQQVFLQEPDSLLPVHSPIRKELVRVMNPVKAYVPRQADATPPILDRVAVVFERSGPRVARYLRKKGMVPRYRQQDGKEVMDVYFDEWFMGRLTMDSEASWCP